MLLVPIKNMPIPELDIVYVTCFLSNDDFSSKFFLNWVTHFFKSTYYTKMQEVSEKNTSLSFCFDKIHICIQGTTHNTHGLWHLLHFERNSHLLTLYFDLWLSVPRMTVCACYLKQKNTGHVNRWNSGLCKCATWSSAGEIIQAGLLICAKIFSNI